MNTLDSTKRDAVPERDARGGFIPTDEIERPLQSGLGSRAKDFLRQLIDRTLRGEKHPPSILRNNTNLPVFLALALGLSLVCNFALKESSAQASRLLGPAATLRDARELVARNPEEPAYHSRLGELYLQQRNYKRAMFHFRESSRLSELYGE